jgi:sulfate transport system permease protein
VSAIGANPRLGALGRRRPRAGSATAGRVGLGIATLWLSIIVLLPLAAVVGKSLDGGTGAFWHAVTSRQALAALRFTLLVSLVVAAVNAVMGLLVAWVLVRDDFPGRRLVNAVIDLPFALPTIVAGITLLALYGPTSPVGVDVAYTKLAVAMALLFVTLPFGVRAVQPVLLELDREMEEAAASLGASPATTFRRIVLPNLMPAILSGAALSFARAVGEFGSVVLISGNKPFDTQVSSVFISKQIESDATASAAAVSVVLLVVSLLVLLGLRGIEHWGNARDL